METAQATATSAPIQVTPQNSQAAPQANSQATTAYGSQAPTDWIGTLNDDLKGYVQNKGFKDPATLIDSYRNLERLRGVPEDRLLKLPEKSDDPTWGNIYEKLGRPKEAKDYNLEIPKEFGDPEFADWSKKLFHENNLTKAQGEAIAKKWNEYIGNKMQADTQMRADLQVKQDAALQKDWGAAYQQNSSIADKAVQLFGPPETAKAVLKAIGDAVGLAEGMKILHQLGTKLGEDSFVNSDSRGPGFGGKMTPAQAKDRIAMLKSDPEFIRRYIAGEAREREEFNKLHEYMVGGI